MVNPLGCGDEMVNQSACRLALGCIWPGQQQNSKSSTVDPTLGVRINRGVQSRSLTPFTEIHNEQRPASLRGREHACSNGSGSVWHVPWRRQFADESRKPEPHHGLAIGPKAPFPSCVQEIG